MGRKSFFLLKYLLIYFTRNTLCQDDYEEPECYDDLTLGTFMNTQIFPEIAIFYEFEQLIGVSQHQSLARPAKRNSYFVQQLAIHAVQAMILLQMMTMILEQWGSKNQNGWHAVIKNKCDWAVFMAVGKIV